MELRSYISSSSLNYNRSPHYYMFPQINEVLITLKCLAQDDTWSVRFPFSLFYTVCSFRPLHFIVHGFPFRTRFWFPVTVHKFSFWKKEKHTNKIEKNPIKYIIPVWEGIEGQAAAEPFSNRAPSRWRRCTKGGKRPQTVVALMLLNALFSVNEQKHQGRGNAHRECSGWRF